jgi:hypothetical protein
MRTPSPITILGISGATELPALDQFRDILLTLEAQRYPNGYPDKATGESARSDMVGELLRVIAVVTFHNTAVNLIRAYQTAERKVHAAKYAAGDAYNDLTARTTTAWHAAHHRYIVAIHNAEAAFAELAEATSPLVTHYTNGWPGQVASFYDQLVVEDQRLDRAALDQIAQHRDVEHELTLFREQHRGHLNLLAYTIAGGVPAGYETDPIPTTDSETARSNW